MKDQELVIYSKRVLLPHEIGAYSIGIKNGKISSIQAGCVPPDEGIPFYNCSEEVLMPGIIDPHVHINEPGRTEWEGFETGTTAAAAGGVTTLVDMPLNASPVTTTIKALEQKIASTQGKLQVNSGFWGGIVPENTADLLPLAKAGVWGFKAFLTHSGIDEFPNVDEATLRAAYKVLKGTQLPVLAHCEWVSGTYNQTLLQQPASYQAYLASRPKKWENDAVQLMLALAEEYQHPTHIVHLASADPIPAIQAAKKRGVPITVETCPHYLFFNAEDIPDGDTRYKCAPPIREYANNVLLWEALIDGTLDFIGSDHSPAPPAIKALDSGNFQKAWGGISGIQFTLAALWTAGQQHGLGLTRLKELLCEQPALFTALDKTKGKIAVGYDADLVVWNPEKKAVITPKTMFTKHKVSPYEGQCLQGVVQHTFVQGQLVWSQGKLITQNQGKALLNKPSLDE